MWSILFPGRLGAGYCIDGLEKFSKIVTRLCRIVRFKKFAVWKGFRQNSLKILTSCTCFQMKFEVIFK